jgi:hypothetical protein
MFQYLIEYLFEPVANRAFIFRKSFFFSGLSFHTAAAKKNPFSVNKFNVVALK